MNRRFALVLPILFLAANAFAAYDPQPLKGIEIGFSVQPGAGGILTYRYSLKNPSLNQESIRSIDIVLGESSAEFSTLNTQLAQCPGQILQTSINSLQSRPGTPVGSTAPNGWDCGYGKLSNFTSVSYGWAAEDNPYLIAPGKTLSGFSLVSNGLPTIRDVQVRPWIDLDLLPDEYTENVPKTIELNAKVIWMGKAVGPQMPPKLFLPLDFLAHIVSLKDQAITLGWLNDKSVEKKMDQLFETARRNLDPCDVDDLKKAIGDLLKLADEKGGKKGMSVEAKALIYYNGKYFLDQVSRVTKDKKCKKGHHEHGGGHEHHDEGHHHGRSDDHKTPK